MFLVFAMVVIISEALNGCHLNKSNQNVSFLKYLPSYLMLGFGLIFIGVLVSLFGKISNVEDGFNVVQKIINTFFGSQKGYGVLMI